MCLILTCFDCEEEPYESLDAIYAYKDLTRNTKLSTKWRFETIGALTKTYLYPIFLSAIGPQKRLMNSMILRITPPIANPGGVSEGDRTEIDYRLSTFRSPIIRQTFRFIEIL